MPANHMNHETGEDLQRDNWANGTGLSQQLTNSSLTTRRRLMVIKMMAMMTITKTMMMIHFNFVLEYVISKFKVNQERLELNDQNPVFVEFSKNFKV
jgi:hypothetical protein